MVENNGTVVTASDAHTMEIFEVTGSLRLLMGQPALPDMEAVELHWERELRASYGPLVAVGGGVRLIQ